MRRRLGHAHLNAEKWGHLPTQHEESRPVPEEIQAASGGDPRGGGHLRPWAAHRASHEPALPGFGLTRRNHVLAPQTFIRAPGEELDLPI